MNRKSKKKVLKIRLTDIIIIFAIIALISGLVNIINSKKGNKEKVEISPEIARSRQYAKVRGGDRSTDSQYVEFDAFFLKDIDGDGNADSIRGTCNEIGKEDTLYMDLKVLNNGTFKNGKITINSSNFYFNTSLVKDNIIKDNYISSNTKIINLKDMHNGSQKLITGMIRSGDYANTYNKTGAIGNNPNKYSQINSITITGTHIDDDGNPTPINKTIDFLVDWYGTTSSAVTITNVKNEVDNMESLISGDNINLNFEIKTEERDNKLILNSANIEGTIPELNGYKATSAEFIGEGIEYTYNPETGAFTARKEAAINDSGVVTGIVNTSSEKEKRYNTFNVKLVYPREAYDNMEDNSIDLFIPVKVWYEGYNNPNEPFDNPYVSNKAETTISARWLNYSGPGFRYDIYVGKYVTYPYERYVVSKEKPLKIYNNISETENKDYYIVRWRLETGRNGVSNVTTMKETKAGQAQVSDIFVKTDASTKSMEDLTSNVGIYFEGADSMLGEDGWIKVYNDTTDELIAIFTKENWNRYNESNPYYYTNSIKHIRVETSGTNTYSVFSAINVKELDDRYISENYEKEEYNKLQHIKSSLTGTFDDLSATVQGSAYYEAPLSVATINLSKPVLSTQETTENQIIKITTDSTQYNEQKWTNGTFLVKIPKEIVDMEINEVTIDNTSVSLLGYDLYEENDNYYIKILTENSNEQTYSISIDCNMTPDPRNTTSIRKVELYAINGQGIDYYFKGNDIYDIDEDSNVQEVLNYVTTNINIVSPNELLTHQIALRYDNENSQTIAPRVAKVEKSQRTAEINVNLTNNYSQEITDVVLQGVIPFEGNQFVIGNTPLGSTYSTSMTNAGITIPTELQGHTTVYYSTKEKPTNDLTDQNNEWKTADQVTDWNAVKTYAIDLGDYVLAKGDSYTFKYTINIPEGVGYNDVTYSEHAIYFSLLTDAGKYSTYTASDKLGFMIAKQYDLEIEKSQENTNKKLQGITFKITEKGKTDGKIKATDNDGKIMLYGLLAEKEYIIKEIRTTDDYVLNEEEIKIYTHTDDSDNLYVAFKNNDGTYTDLENKYSWVKSANVIKENEEDYKVNIQLENEPKARLKVVKKDRDNNVLSGVRFILSGRNKDNVILITNNRGEINTSGLYLNEQYTLTETKATGYYIPTTPITFRLSDNGSLQASGDGLTSNSVSRDNEIPVINLQIENEKIPEYSLKVIKKEKDTDTILKGTQFKITGEDKNENVIYTTDNNGTIQIDNLYEFVEGKNVEAKYTLQEIYPSEGYVLNETPLVFKAKRDNNNELKLEIESGSIRGEAEIDNTDPTNPIITVTIDNEPVFTLTKVDEETNEPLEGVEFTITDLNDNPVTDINGNDLSKVTTDENGKIRLGLAEGLYKAVETKQLPGYQEPELYTGIGIGESKEATTEMRFDKYIDKLSYYPFYGLSEVEDGVVGFTNNGQIIRLDSEGNTVWKAGRRGQQTYYYFYGGTAVEDGIVAVGGRNIVKYDFDGNMVWQRQEESCNFYGAGKVNDGVIVYGVYNYANGRLVKYDLNGNKVWEYNDLPGGSNVTGVWRPKIVEDGIIIISSNGTVTKVSFDGSFVWQNTDISEYRYGGVALSDGVITFGSYGRLVKYNLNGEIVFDIEDSRQDYKCSYYDAVVVNDGFIAMSYYGVIAKYDFEGHLIWENREKTYSYQGLAKVEDGIIAVSYSGHVVKYDFNGRFLWEDSDKTHMLSGIVDAGDGLIAYMGTGLLKFDYEGNLIKENIIGISLATGNRNNCKIKVDDGIIIVGQRGTITKFDFSLNRLWINSLNNSSYTYQSVTAVNDGYIAITGRGPIVKYGLNGNKIWEKTINTNFYGRITTVEDGVILGGSTDYMKIDFDGNLIWTKQLGADYSNLIAVEDGFIVTKSGSLKKFDNDGNLVWENNEITSSIAGLEAVDDGIFAITSNYGKIAKYDLNGNLLYENDEIYNSGNYNDIEVADDKLFILESYDGLAMFKNKITEPEIPVSQNVIVKNKQLQYKIITKVRGSGGTISGLGDDPYEQVKHGEDSVKQIKATPDAGYSVAKITVNGEEIDFIENDDGTVTLSKFVNMTEDKEVIVWFTSTKTKVEVNHYLWKEDTGTTTTSVADSSTKAGYIGDDYTTTPKFDLDNYEIIKNKDYYGDKTEEQIITEINTEYGTSYTSITDLGYEEITDPDDEDYGKTPFEQFKEDFYIPQNSRGQFKTEKQYINYYYKEKTYTLTVKHLLEGTEDRVPNKTSGEVEDEITDGYKKYVDDTTTPGSRYTTTQSDQIDYEKYELVSEPDNKNGTISEDTEVRYYYRQKQHKITTKVQEHEETDSLGTVTIVKGGSISGENQSPYETVKHGEDSTKEIKAIPDTNYSVKTITVNGTPIEFTPNADGTVTLSNFINVTEDKEVIVEFAKKQGTVIIHHYIEGTTTKIDLKDGTKAEDEIRTGNIGDIYASKVNGDAALKYVVVNNVPDRSSGTYIDGTIEVTYYYRERQVQVTVNKVWNDNNNRLGIRPTQIQANLKAYILNDASQEEDVTTTAIPEGVPKQVTLNNGTGTNNGNNWTYTWQGLNQYTSESKEIIYKVEEVPLTGNAGVVYSAEVTKDTSNPYSLTITNTYNRPTEKIKYVVDKVWDDNSDENSKRPDKLVLNINKVDGNNTTQDKTYTINTNSETSHTFELDRYDEKGNEINYVAEEAEKNTGDLYFYTQTGGQRQEITIENKKAYKSEFTNKFTVPDDKVDIEVTKEWSDNSDENQKRPGSIKLVLYKVQSGTNVKITEYTLNTPSTDNSFNYTFANQAKYDEHGNEIVYIVDEEVVNSDDLKFYTKTVTPTGTNKYKVTNTFTVPEEQIEIEAEKVWNEANETQRQKRPSSVMLKLMNGTTEVNSDVANTDNNWKVTFNNLAKYDSRGREIPYKLDEEEVNTDDLKFYTNTGSSNLIKIDDTHYKLTYTNTFNVPADKKETTVTKVWDDENGKDRINSVKLILTGNGQSYNHTLTNSNVDNTNPNNWVYTFTNLPKYNSNGEEIEYTLTEEAVNSGDLDKYITNVNGYNVTNELIVKDTKIEKTGPQIITSLDEKINYTIKYEAKIASSYTGKVTVKITDTLPYKIDTEKEKNLNGGTYKADNNTITWEEEVTPTDGKVEITKTISFVYKEMPVNIDKFTNKVKGKLELQNGITEEKEAQIDTQVNFKRNIVVTKVWRGDTNSNTRPKEAVVELLKDGNVIDRKTIKEENNWKATFEGLDKYDKTTREEIVYTVREQNVPEGYYAEVESENVTITGANNLGFKITNNKYGKITIIKEDKLNHTKRIGGAEITLTKLKEEKGKWVKDETYKEVTEITSNDPSTIGIAEFENLVYGKYRIEETKAPEGYEKISKTVDIEINESNPEVQTSIKNKQKTALPATGAVARGIMIMLGIAMIITAIRIKRSSRSTRKIAKRHSK